jgi:hypothetical protein
VGQQHTAAGGAGPQQQEVKGAEAGVGVSGRGARVEHILGELAATKVARIRGLSRHPVDSLLALGDHPSARPLGPLMEALALGK